MRRQVELLEEIEDKKAFLAQKKKELEVLAEKIKELGQEVVFEDTLLGQIEEVEIKAKDAIITMLNTLTEKTGKIYVFTFGEVVRNEAVGIKVEKIEPILGYSGLSCRRAIEDMVCYVRANGHWSTERTLREWIRRTLDEIFNQ